VAPRSRAPWLRYTFDEKAMKALARTAPRR